MDCSESRSSVSLIEQLSRTQQRKYFKEAYALREMRCDDHHRPGAELFEYFMKWFDEICEVVRSSPKIATDRGATWRGGVFIPPSCRMTSEAEQRADCKTIIHASHSHNRESAESELDVQSGIA